MSVHMAAFVRRRKLWTEWGRIALGFLLSLHLASGQTNKTWTGTVNSDWFNLSNWSPPGVPASNDIINVTNGTINLTAPVALNGQFNWTGGTLSGSSLTIASNGAMQISGNGTLFLQIPLTNAGTVTWTNTVDLDVQNNNGVNLGLIENLSGALWDIQGNQSLYNNSGTAAYFRNAGTLRKSALSGLTAIQIPFINSGSVTGLQGTLSFFNGGTLAGTFTAAASATINFSSGNFTNAVPVSINGPGTVQLTSIATLTLLTDTLANLALAGGTVILGPAFQGGTITNFTINGATLAGTNLVTGTFNWNNGIINGPLTIANNAKMNISGTTTLQLQNVLTNAGTVAWTNHGDLDAMNGSGVYFALIENLPGALWDIQCDQSLFNNAGTAAYFHNAGTLRKSALSGGTSFQIPLINSGSVTGLQGTIFFGGGGTLAGSFTAAASAALTFSAGSYTNSGPVAMNGPGLIQMQNGTLTLLTDPIANLALTGGTVILGPAFQGGTITNFTIAGATLAGTNTVSGTFNWNNGTVLGALTIQSNALLNLNGTTTMYLEGPLTNLGTVKWTNSCPLDVLNGSGVYFGLIENLAGGLWDIQCDQQILNNAGTAAYFHNLGMLRKSASTGVTSFNLPIFNSGTVTNLQGTLRFGTGGLLTGTFTASAGAEIDFSGGTFTNSVPVSINGPGVIQFTGGNLLLLSDTITNLPLTGGTVNLGPAFQGGSITNLTIVGATLAGTNTVTGIFNWNNGVIAGGPLTIASNGVMNMNPTTTIYLENPLTNFGTVTWTNSGFSGSLDVLNNNGAPYAALIENEAGALFDIRCDQSMFNNASTSLGYFNNAGTLQKSAKTGTTAISIPLTNSGTIAVLHGNIALSGGFPPVGGTLEFGMSSPSSYGSLSISGNAQLAGSLGVVWLNGFVPAFGNAFTLLNYGSFTGSFTNLNLPSAALWSVSYGPTAFTLTVTNINKLAFTTQPSGGKLPGQILSPIVVQVEDPSGNPVALNGLAVTISLNSGTGNVNGTLTKNTDPAGQVTFSDLSLDAVGTKTLRAAATGLTAGVSTSFQIVPPIGLQLTGSGFLLQLNGTNSHGITTISTSTNLSSPWLPIYTNAPTNGVIQFLDTAATNYPIRFYRIIEQ